MLSKGCVNAINVLPRSWRLRYILWEIGLLQFCNLIHVLYEFYHKGPAYLPSRLCKYQNSSKTKTSLAVFSGVFSRIFLIFSQYNRLLNIQIVTIFLNFEPLAQRAFSILFINKNSHLLKGSKQEAWNLHLDMISDFKVDIHLFFAQSRSCMSYLALKLCCENLENFLEKFSNSAVTWVILHKTWKQQQRCEVVWEGAQDDRLRQAEVNRTIKPRIEQQSNCFCGVGSL